MTARLSAGKVRKICQFIEMNARQHDVRTMCRVLQVAPSGYYAWLHAPVSERAREDARLLRLIKASFVARHGIYGAPGVFLDLRETGETCSKHRVTRLMRVNNIRAVRRYRTRHHGASKPSELAPNVLQRNFDVSKPNELGYRPWQSAAQFYR